MTLQSGETLKATTNPMNDQARSIFDEIEAKFDLRAQGGLHDSPQWMRRCFMTGKQCIFCPQETVFEKGTTDRKRDSVFVIMPFTPNLQTFYEWSLNPYLQFFGIHKEKIRRADQFSNTGYVMCEKICLRIQQAGFVVVDLSLYNPNVYYELGIAVGLNKPILAVCDGKKKHKVEKLCKAVGLDSEEVLYYPNVGYIDVNETPLLKRIQKVRLEARKVTMKTVGLLLTDEQERKEDESPYGNATKDINVVFPKALEAAVGVAMREMEQKYRKKADEQASTDDSGSNHRGSDSADQLAAMLNRMSEDELEKLRGWSHSFIMDDKGSPHEFRYVADNLNTALIAIVDLVRQDSLSYFWLGYCHARNINVVPIYRTQPDMPQDPHPSQDRAPSAPPTSPSLKENQPKGASEHILAFDIRALWYMRHDPDKAKELASKLAAVFEPILLRDVATQQRRIFWERLTRSGKVLIYNGAIHYDVLNREVVGDWDLRTASELITYLSSTDESVMPVLQNPLYSPETVAEKIGIKPDAKFLKAYEEAVKDQLKGKNCIVVASADVNPITEIILANIQKRRIEPFTAIQLEQKNSLVVAFKGSGRSPKGLPRHFCVFDENPDERGFYIEGKRRSEKYSPQDKAEKQEILAHLVVARNPFSPENVVVVLDGVSGPATFGLAELLTGGANGGKAASSEDLLKKINDKWATRVEAESKFKGVEAIVSVSVSPPASGLTDSSTGNVDDLKSRIDEKLFDRRSVGKWGILAEDDLLMTGDNPREFPS